MRVSEELLETISSRQDGGKRVLSQRIAERELPNVRITVGRAISDVIICAIQDAADWDDVMNGLLYGIDELAKAREAVRIIRNRAERKGGAA